MAVVCYSTTTESSTRSYEKSLEASLTEDPSEMLSVVPTEQCSTNVSSPTKRVLVACLGLDTKIENMDHVECRASTWVEAADGIIHFLTSRGVGRGQVLAVDAHGADNRFGQGSIISAHYSTSLPYQEPLKMRYIRCEMAVEDAGSWATLRGNAIAKLGSKLPISITSSCSSGLQAVFCCFYSSQDPRTEQLQEVTCVVGSSWTEAADELVATLEAADLRMGQVCCIDTYWLPGQNKPAGLSAYYCRSLEGTSPLHIAYKCQTGGSWSKLYDWVSQEVQSLGLTRRQVLGITYCVAPTIGMIGFLFFEQSACQRTAPDLEPTTALTLKTLLATPDLNQHISNGASEQPPPELVDRLTDPGNEQVDIVTDPGTDPGTYPDTDPGTDPATDLAADLATDPGTDLGADPGTATGTAAEPKDPPSISQDAAVQEIIAAVMLDDELSAAVTKDPPSISPDAAVQRISTEVMRDDDEVSDVASEGSNRNQLSHMSSSMEIKWKTAFDSTPARNVPENAMQQPLCNSGGGDIGQLRNSFGAPVALASHLSRIQPEIVQGVPTMPPPTADLAALTTQEGDVARIPPLLSCKKKLDAVGGQVGDVVKMAPMPPTSPRSMAPMRMSPRSISPTSRRKLDSEGPMLLQSRNISLDSLGHQTLVSDIKDCSNGGQVGDVLRMPPLSPRSLHLDSLGHQMLVSDIREPPLSPRSRHLSPRSCHLSLDVEGFEVLHGKNIGLDSLGQQMLVSDIKDCKRLCRFRGYGAFVLNGGRAFFKKQDARQCLQHLVNQPGCTVYLNILPGCDPAISTAAKASVGALKRRSGPMKQGDRGVLQMAQSGDEIQVNECLDGDEIQTKSNKCRTTTDSAASRRDRSDCPTQ